MRVAAAAISRLLCRQISNKLNAFMQQSPRKYAPMAYHWSPAMLRSILTCMTSPDMVAVPVLIGPSPSFLRPFLLHTLSRLAPWSQFHAFLLAGSVDLARLLTCFKSLIPQGIGLVRVPFISTISVEGQQTRWKSIRERLLFQEPLSTSVFALKS